MKSQFIKSLLVGCFIVGILAEVANGAILSVRLIKAKPSRCAVAPTLQFLFKPTSYSLVPKEWYNGENDWEIFFEIETEDKNIPLEQLSITAKGVEVLRAIVGRTDVPFTKLGDDYQFKLVDDTRDGRHVQTSYQNPKGGPHMWIFHNWKDRVNGNYLNYAYPKKALAASLNYVIACQEMLRLMGDMSGLNQKFYGELILLNCESSAPRAHLDFPPHWHLQHWEHDKNEEYGIDWRKKQYIIPHYYLDSVGHITSNKVSFHQSGKAIKQPKDEFFPGDTCTWKDVAGNLIFKQVIENGSLHFIKSKSEVWTLQPDKAGGAKGVWIIKNKIPLAIASAVDDGEKGTTTIVIEYYKNKKHERTRVEEVLYDPFTGLTKSKK